MPRYVVIFRDNPAAIAVREQNQQAHFDYLAENSDRIRLGGGLRQDWDAPWSGGLWVIEVADRTEAARLAEGDPWFKLGLRAGYEIFAWGKAPVYGEVKL